MPAQESQFDFLSLPLKARLRTYEYILIGKPQVIPLCKPPAQRSIAPTILRTCKQIHIEASPVLYSKNTFLIAKPERDLKWLQEIGRANVKLLNSISIFVHGVYYTEDTFFGNASEAFRLWYKLLDQLAREATGLRHVYIEWDADETYNYFGAGKDLRFVRELAKIQGLQSMVVSGLYAIPWPRYLAEKMGVPVQQKGPIEDDVRKYQRGTENLIP